MTIYEVRHGSTKDQMKDVVKAYYCHNVEKDMPVHDIFMWLTVSAYKWLELSLATEKHLVQLF